MSDQTGSADTSSSSDLKAGHAPANKVGGMRVGAPRPRHTSHGEEKSAGDNVESGQETTGDNKAAQEGGAGNTTGDANDDQASGAVANRAAGEMVAGTFVPVCKQLITQISFDVQENETLSESSVGSGIGSNTIFRYLLNKSTYRIKEAFPTEAVKHIHDKPGVHPKHDIHTHGRHDDQRFINQPRKQ
ncbi:unnamed protein product [Adineta ricciae]|uniref:Uncharacterized protein n=1 Tax=Adineta ricciae TaxID=249248 RepID=A0A815TK98_ADIRI|nr:unnamed protein product [Adineta ricciae]